MKPATSYPGIRNNYLLPVLTICLLLFVSCSKETTITATTNNNTTTTQQPTPKYTITQTVSDEAQRNTIAFDALGFMVGNLGAQTFLPPGKVADYSGFQYLRDNDLTNMGHNTDFVTIVAYNVLNILNQQQIQQFVNAASSQVTLINQYGYKRFPLCKAFRRLIGNDLPAGKTQLDETAVKNYSAQLYALDGEISYKRAQLFGQVIGSFSVTQKAQMDALAAKNGVGNWNRSIADPLASLHLSHDEGIAVMTFASEMYAWYAGSIDADVYFCPERQGTYFGSFYLKDWPAMGNPNYTINEQLTATAGQQFLNILTPAQYSLIAGIVDLQKSSLLALVDKRREVSVELRKFLSGSSASSSLVQTLSESYGQYDGAIISLYATRFSQVYNSLSATQKSQVIALGNSLGYIDPTGAFLYSQPVAMPVIENTDYLFR